MSHGYRFLGRPVSGPFTIPSGIVATATPIIRYLFDRVPQVGVMTTKSIGPVPRAGNREPIMTQYAPGCFMNAVGLTNPGAQAAREQLAALEVPDDRFLLTSIFGGSVREIVGVARLLAPVSHGLELNLSCPHASGYGMDMGQDAELVREITAEVKSAVDIPVIPKLTPNVPNIGEIAEAAVAGGADALCAINTLGPAWYTCHGEPVLTNQLGGMSGRGILPITLKCIREIRAAVDVPIIGCGGVTTAEDVRAIANEGASVYGVGSALTGMDSRQIADYFARLEQNLEQGGSETGSPGVSSGVSLDWVPVPVDMSFTPFRLVSKRMVCEDIAILTFDGRLSVAAGQFIYTWIPGLGEKPFSALTDDPFSLVVINVGLFTDALMKLEAGATVYVRGPYGVQVSPPAGSKMVAIAGGTGLAAVYQLVRDFGNADNTEVFLGARSAGRLYFRDECSRIAGTHIATDDGSEGYRGRVTELLESWLRQQDESVIRSLVFYNCGPAPMVQAATEVQRRFVADSRINNAIDYLTRCGVGICGACHAPDGRRLCVDGPFLTPS